MEQRRWILIPPAIWIACIMLIQIMGAFTAPASSEIPEECPEASRNCARMMMGLDGTPQEVHAAAMNWVNSQINELKNFQYKILLHSLQQNSICKTILIPYKL